MCEYFSLSLKLYYKLLALVFNQSVFGKAFEVDWGQLNHFDVAVKVFAAAVFFYHLHLSVMAALAN